MSYLVPLWLPASIWLPSPFCTHLSSLRYKPDCVLALPKSCLWFPITLGLTQSSRVWAPSISSSPSPAVALILMTQDGSYTTSLYIHIPGNRMAVGKPHFLIQLAGHIVTNSCCHPSCIPAFPPHSGHRNAI